MTWNGNCLKILFRLQKSERFAHSSRSRGRPHVPFRYVLNSLLYILITGCRWCDLPQGEIWASKSAAHRWLKRWQKDGTFEHWQSRILAIADKKGLINGNFGAGDGSSCSVLYAEETLCEAVSFRTARAVRFFPLSKEEEKRLATVIKGKEF